MERMNKRGQNMTLGTIILIVLGIAVLVLLIFGFSTGWGNLWDRIVNIQGKSNVDTIKSSCETACAASNTYAFCSEQRELKYGAGVVAWDSEDKKIKENVKSTMGTCNDFANDKSLFKPQVDEKNALTGEYEPCKAEEADCKIEKYNKVKISKCPKISC